MRRILLLLHILLFGLNANAQDTLWVKKMDGKPFVVHNVKSGEDIFLLSKKYKVPPAALADANSLSYGAGLASGSTVWIPVDNYNFIRIESVVKSKPIYYKANRNETLKDVTRMVNVAQSTLQMWNHMSQQAITPGQTLQIGWIAFDDTQVPLAKNHAAFDARTDQNVAPVQLNDNAVITKIPLKDSGKTSNDTLVVNPYEQLYQEQIMGHANNEESGAAVFYPLKMKLSDGVYYALHNTAAKGTIIKITNPANGNIIYAKVIGTIPDIKDYYNAVVALTQNAAKGLLAKERRMFCKLEY